MNHKTKVSAIVSIYNAENFIQGKIEDLLAQSLGNNLEIIIINSGSPQNEDQIIQPYLLKYPNIVYIKTEERETIYRAWNRAIRQASGTYITNSNVDDRLSKTALEELSDVLDNNPEIALVYADQYISPTANETFNEIYSRKSFHWGEYTYLWLLESCLVGPQPMWRSSVHTQYNIWFDESLEIAGDYDFALNVARIAPLKKLPKINGVYYLSPTQANKEYQNKERTKREAETVRLRYLPAYLNKLSADELFVLRKKFRFLSKLSPFSFIFAKIAAKIFIKERVIPTKEFSVWIFNQIENFLAPTTNSIRDSSAHHTVSLKGTNDTGHVSEQPCQVSVIVPTFNRPHLLQLALDSIAQQTFKDFEVLVINNGDTPVDEIIKIYSGKCRITLLSSPKKASVSSAKNFGLREAKGRYICYLDDDDWYNPNHIETLYTAITSSNCSLVYADADVHLQDFSDGTYITKKKFIEYSIDFKQYLLLIKDYIFTPCVMHEKKCFNICGGFDESLNTDEDMDLWIRFSKLFKFKHIPIVTCNVRRTNNAEQLSKNWEVMYQNAKKVYKKHQDTQRLNPIVKLGQYYYLSMRKKRAQKQKNATNNNYY